MKAQKFPGILCSSILITLSIITSLSTTVLAYKDSEYLEIDLEYLAAHMADFYGVKVRTVGTVNFMASIYMFEDFWLSRAILVVVRFAELPTPPENSSIEVFGIIEYSELEGGFFYLNAHHWIFAQEETMPEFQPLIMLSLFMVATILATIIYKRKQFK